MVYNDPSTFVGLVGKVRKKTIREGGESGPQGPGLKPGTCRVLDKRPQLHAMGVVYTSKPFHAYR